MKLPLTMMTLGLFLTACHNYTNDYVNAQNHSPLKTPPGVHHPTFMDHNPIPAKSSSDPITPASLVPPGLLEDEASAKIALAKTTSN